MRILLMANNVQELGGAQRVVHVLAQGLADRGHDVTIVGITPHPAPYRYQGNPSYREVTLLDGPYPKPSAARIHLEAVATSRLQALLDEGPPGVIITAQLWAMEHLLWKLRAICQYAARRRGAEVRRVAWQGRGVDRRQTRGNEIGI